MPLKAPSLAILAAVTALAMLGSASAQSPGAPATSVAPPSYRPGLGDLMTMTVQPRHTKLGLPGQEKNWVYAAYELHELEESFERAVRVWPMYRKVNIAELLPSTTKEPMEAVAAAIKAAQVRRGLRAADRDLQCLPSSHRTRLRRHPGAQGLVIP